MIVLLYILNKLFMCSINTSDHNLIVVVCDNDLE
jgi:hypothetical protein